MKRKLLMLSLALAAVMGSLTSLATADEPCNFEVCCPSRGCFCCDEPCAIRCEP
jgi:hypothetical protein